MLWLANLITASVVFIISSRVYVIEFRFMLQMIYILFATLFRISRNAIPARTYTSSTGVEFFLKTSKLKVNAERISLSRDKQNNVVVTAMYLNGSNICLIKKKLFARRTFNALLYTPVHGIFENFDARSLFGQNSWWTTTRNQQRTNPPMKRVSKTNSTSIAIGNPSNTILDRRQKIIKLDLHATTIILLQFSTAVVIGFMMMTVVETSGYI